MLSGSSTYLAFENFCLTQSRAGGAWPCGCVLPAYFFWGGTLAPAGVHGGTLDEGVARRGRFFTNTGETPVPPGFFGG